MTSAHILESAISRMLGNQLRSDQAHYESALDRGERAAKAQADLREAFLSLAAGGSLEAVATFAGPMTDYRTRTPDGKHPKRPATLFDVLREMSEYRDFDRRLMDVFMRAANGADVAAEAAALMQDLAKLYAEQNVDID
jgi:hypothetical protein